MSKTKSVMILRGNGQPFRAKKVDRNKPCKCGSGKKAKNCCGGETEYFTMEKETQGTK